MGGGLTKQQQEAVASAKMSPLCGDYPSKVFIDKVLVKAKIFSENNQWEERNTALKGGRVLILS